MNKASLGDYVAIKTGKLDANAADENGLYPFFTCAERVLRINTPAYDCECVLVAGNGDLNVKYYSGKFNAYQRTYIIETKDSENLTVPYLYRFLDYYVETLRNQSIGGVIKYIKLGNLTGALIPLVGIDEQHSTVSLFDGLDAVINKTRQQLIKYDTLIKSRFIEMFGNPIENDRGLSKCLWSDALTIVNGKNQKKVECANGEYAICGSGGEMGRATQYLTSVG